MVRAIPSGLHGASERRVPRRPRWSALRRGVLRARRLRPPSRTAFLRETRAMRHEEPEPGGPPGPVATLRRIFPYEAAASSDQLGWVGLEAARYRAAPASELSPPGITHPRLVLFSRPPEQLDL